jgi:Big-like domain-containing protein
MSHGRPHAFPARLLPALALLLSLSHFGGACTQNAGRVFSGGGGGDGGGGEEGGGVPPRPPGPTQALYEGALLLDGAPVAQAFGPADGATEVDVQSPIAIWFSESLANTTVNATSLGVRRLGGTGGVQRTTAFFAGDRCVLLVPTVPLEAEAEYEIFATDDLHDLDGTRLAPPDDNVLSRFTTSTSTSGLDPKVVVAFPPAGFSDQPNTHEVVVVFSKPVSYISALLAIHVDQLDGAGGVIGSAAVDAPAASQHGGRVFPYTRTENSDAFDLGARLAVNVDAGVVDTEFTTHTMQTSFQSIWNTLSFGPPVALDTAPTPGATEIDLNLAFLNAYPVNVHVDGNGLQLGDALEVRLTESSPLNPLLGVLGDTQTGNVSANNLAGNARPFRLNLQADPLIPGLSLIKDGSLAISCMVERNGLRSTVRELTGRVQDTVPPGLQRFGPPYANSAGTFLSDLPEFRVYGIANEGISLTAARVGNNLYLERAAITPSSQDWFLGPEISGVSAATQYSFDTTDFELILTDTAGNPMAGSIGGRVGFHSFIGLDAAVDQMTLQVVDARSLAPVLGATFQIEAVDGTDFRSSVESLVGEQVFTGLAGRAYNVTISAPGYHTATYYGVDRTLASLPLRPVNGFEQNISPVITLSNANGGEVRLASPLLLDTDLRLEPDAMVDVTVPFGFEYSGSPVQSDRPGWFAAFFRLDAADPFRQFAADPRFVVDPFSASTIADVPALDMVEIDSVLREDYAVDWAPAAGNPDFQTSAVTRIPGLSGLATIGIGEDLAGGPGTIASTVTVIEELREAAADLQGVDAADLSVDLLVRAYFAGQVHVMAQVRDALSGSPNTVVFPSNVPTVQTSGLDPAAIAGVALQFRDSLGLDGDPGYYLITLNDGVAQWDLWVPASLRQAGDPVLPTLDLSPLDSNIDAVWTMFAEAFHMPTGFSESGFFFATLRRDFDALARSDLRTVTL